MLPGAEVLQVSAELCGLITPQIVGICPEEFHRRVAVANGFWRRHVVTEAKTINCSPLLAVTSHFKAAF